MGCRLIYQSHNIQSYGSSIEILLNSNSVISHSYEDGIAGLPVSIDENISRKNHSKVAISEIELL